MIPHLLFAACMVPLGVITWAACWHLTETPALRHALDLCKPMACLRCARARRPYGV